MVSYETAPGFTPPGTYVTLVTVSLYRPPLKEAPACTLSPILV